MVLPDEQRSDRDRPRAWWRRWRPGRLALPVAAAILLLLTYWGELSLVQALIGFAVIAVPALIDVYSQHGHTTLARSRDEGRVEAVDQIIASVLSGLPNPVVVIDRQGIVRGFNRDAVDRAPALAVGQPLSFALRNPGVTEALRHALRTGARVMVDFSERVPADRWWEAVIAPISIETAAGSRGLFVVAFHDKTTLRQVEEMRADFVANASHELRTPLASLSGFIDTLLGPARADAEARERFLGIMKQQADRMARVIDDLLSLSRIELKAHVYPDRAVDLASILRQVADALQLMARGRDITIELDIPTGPLLVLGDRDELIRVFENLIENALKYGASGKRVETTLVREENGEGAEAAIAVRDYGPGIAPEHLPRLTERFYRVDVQESRAQGGTGLGLALVKHIVQRHRGRLAIESTPGQGATFTVRLPLAPASQAESSAFAANGPGSKRSDGSPARA